MFYTHFFFCLFVVFIEIVGDIALESNVKMHCHLGEISEGDAAYEWSYRRNAKKTWRELNTSTPELSLDDLSVVDNGDYKCRVRLGANSGEKIMSIDMAYEGEARHVFLNIISVLKHTASTYFIPFTFTVSFNYRKEQLHTPFRSYFFLLCLF